MPFVTVCGCGDCHCRIAIGVDDPFIAGGVGLGTLLAQSATAFAVLKWFGVAYLVWLGGKWREVPQLMKWRRAGRRPSSGLCFGQRFCEYHE